MTPSKHETVRPKPLRALRVRASLLAASDARGCLLDVGSWRFRCSIGRSGMTRAKREGDGGSPIGGFRILSWRFRPSKGLGPRPPDPWRVIRRLDGWCDDLASGVYNREIELPSGRGHERMWRADQKYDIVAILDYNIRPRVIGRGSAIFFHLCSEDYETTAGCVAITAADMRKLIPRLAPNAKIKIG